MNEKINSEKLKATTNILHEAFNDGYAIDILTLLMTTDERDALNTRIKIVKALLEGSINQRELKKELGVGIATVTRGSNSLKEISPEFKIWLERVLVKKSDRKIN